MNYDVVAIYSEWLLWRYGVRLSSNQKSGFAWPRILPHNAKSSCRKALKMNLKCVLDYPGRAHWTEAWGEGGSVDLSIMWLWLRLTLGRGESHHVSRLINPMLIFVQPASTKFDKSFDQLIILRGSTTQESLVGTFIITNPGPFWL